MSEGIVARPIRWENGRGENDMNGISANALTFATLDANASGDVSQQEFTQGVGLLSSAARTAMAQSGKDAASLFASFDADKNGSLSESELSQGLDGLLSSESLSGLLQAQQTDNPYAALMLQNQVSLYNALPNIEGGLATTAQAVLSAYSALLA